MLPNTVTLRIRCIKDYFFNDFDQDSVTNFLKEGNHSQNRLWFHFLLDKP